MPVDKQVLKDVIREAVGDDGELSLLLEQKLLQNDDTAAKFVGGFLRDRDYRTKTQTLASDRQTLADEKKAMEDRLEQYRQLLEAAESDKAKVMRDLQDRKIEVATANARLRHIKSAYNLSDEDIPSIPDQIQTYQTGKVVDSSTDIDSRLAGLKKDILNEVSTFLAQKLIPELGGFARLPGIFTAVHEEHKELTGKRLSEQEHDELLNEADRRNKAGNPRSYRQLWEEKYDVPGLRQKQHDKELETKLRAAWDAEQQAKISEAALAGVKPIADGLRTSQILDHKFHIHEEQPAGAPKPREAPSAAEREALSGAQRATQAYLQRRNSGIPMGAPHERKGPGKAA